MPTTENSICQCNKLTGNKTLHPLVSVINLTGKVMLDRARLDCYSLLLTPGPVKNPAWGWKSCDFTHAMLLAQAPDSSLAPLNDGGEMIHGRLLLFHRDLLACQSLGHHISDYTFFKYRPQEALFLSESEETIANNAINAIDRELRWGIDELSATILTDKIKLLLDYVRRFQLRQFITREDNQNAPLMQQLNDAIDQYILSGRVRRSGMPCACRLATSLDVSTAFLHDLVRHESGMQMTEYVQQRRLFLAHKLLEQDQYSEAKVAFLLGYGSVEKLRQYIAPKK